MVNRGYYVVHRCEGAGPELKLGTCYTRASLVSPPEVIRYECKEIGKDLLVMNERGDIVFFQSYEPELEEGMTIELAYKSGVGFDTLYANMLKQISEFTSVSLQDADDTFLVEFAENDVSVNWASCKLPLDIGEAKSWQLLSEALFAFSLRERTERLLQNLTTSMPSRPDLKPLLKCAGDLVQLETPSQFLTSKREIDLMSQFYDQWDLTSSTKKLQERVSQLISSYSVLFDQQQARRSTMISRIAAGIGLLALLSVSESISELLGLEKSTTIDAILIALAILVIVQAILTSFVIPILSSSAIAISKFFQRQAVRRKLK